MKLLFIILHYLDPIIHLGSSHRPLALPFIGTFLTALGLEVYANYIAHDPTAIGLAPVYLFMALIIYFSFHGGIRAGAISSSITLLYYFFIIYSRNYTGERFNTSVELTLILGVIYYILALVIGWLKQTVDTLIQREADEKKRLEAIIQQMPVGIIITDSQGKVVQTNPQLESILGFTIPKDFKLGEKMIVPAAINHQPAKPKDSPLFQAIKHGKPVTDRQFSFLKPSGEPAHVSVNASVVHNQQGKLIAGVSLIQDITQQKKEENRKDDFINMASHELKTPVTSLKLYLDSLSMQIQKLDHSRLKHTVNQLLIQTDRLENLIHNLLDVSRLQTGKLALNYQQFHLDHLLQELCDGYQRTHPTHQIEYNSRPCPSINGDRLRLYQVFNNLIDNAIKYSPEQSTVTITLNIDTKFITVSIKDSGIGITQKQQQKIFDRLYQVDSNPEKTFPGLGMGLYIAKQIINAHHGDIWVKSELGQGAEFFVKLPIKHRKSSKSMNI